MKVIWQDKNSMTLVFVLYKVEHTNLRRQLGSCNKRRPSLLLLDMRKEMIFWMSQKKPKAPEEAMAQEPEIEQRDCCSWCQNWTG